MTPHIRTQIRLSVGLLGILCIAMMTTLNEQVSSQALPDILGGMGISRDPGRWFTSLYSAAEVIGAGFSPWMAISFSIRRWAFILLAIALSSSILIPSIHTLAGLYILRTLQGFAGGASVPLMMFATLRTLSYTIRLYGLAAYALTATCFPYLSTALAGLWTDFLDWRFVFYQSIPLAFLSFSLVSYGVPITEAAYGRFKIFNWRGALLFIIFAWCLTILLLQGDWLDWFNSPFICVLALIIMVSLPLLIWNECTHEMPFFRFSLLKRKNYLYGVTAIFLFVTCTISATTLPNKYLTMIAGYRPEQSYWVTIEVALFQIIISPLVAYILNKEYIDSRLIGFLGMVFMLIACSGESFITSFWLRQEFYFWQFFQALGGVMIVVSLLMMSTNAVVPAESPFAVALVNVPRALGQVFGVWLIDLSQHWRGALHSDRISDYLGTHRYRLYQGVSSVIQRPTPLTPDGKMTFPHSVSFIKQQFHHQVSILVFSDLFFIILALLFCLMVLILCLPQRTFPPWIIFKHR